MGVRVRAKVRVRARVRVRAKVRVILGGPRAHLVVATREEVDELQRVVARDDHLG